MALRTYKFVFRLDDAETGDVVIEMSQHLVDIDIEAVKDIGCGPEMETAFEREVPGYKRVRNKWSIREQMDAITLPVWYFIANRLSELAHPDGANVPQA